MDTRKRQNNGRIYFENDICRSCVVTTVSTHILCIVVSPDELLMSMSSLRQEIQVLLERLEEATRLDQAYVALCVDRPNSIVIETSSVMTVLKITVSKTIDITDPLVYTPNAIHSFLNEDFWNDSFVAPEVFDEIHEKSSRQCI